MKFIFKLIGNSWIKDNIGMIILVPTVLGGIWQIIELARIGIPFIRFFSVSQLVSDGLLLLFIFAWTYLVWTITVNSLAIKQQGHLESEINNDKSTSVEVKEDEQAKPPISKRFFIKVQRKNAVKKRDGYIWMYITEKLTI